MRQTLLRRNFTPVRVYIALGESGAFFSTPCVKYTTRMCCTQKGAARIICTSCLYKGVTFIVFLAPRGHQKRKHFYVSTSKIQTTQLKVSSSFTVAYFASDLQSERRFQWEVISNESLSLFLFGISCCFAWCRAVKLPVNFQLSFSLSAPARRAIHTPFGPRCSFYMLSISSLVCVVCIIYIDSVPNSITVR
jgi:hypothetical protein